MAASVPPGKELIVTRSLPTRTLPGHPDLDQLKRQAKELQRAFIAGEAMAVQEVNAHYRDPDPTTFALHDAQLVLARAYGFESWPKLKAFVDGATVRRLVEAVRGRDHVRVQSFLTLRPELARMGVDNMGAIHHAVLERDPEMVRILMAHGASAREGVYPYRDATTAQALAAQRGYTEIVAIIEEEEQKRRDATSGRSETPAAEELFRAVGSGDSDTAIAMIGRDPTLVHARSLRFSATPLHAAALALDARLVTWLLERGSDPVARDARDFTPLDLAAQRWYHADTRRLEEVAGVLLRAGAPMTAPAAVALGEADWLRARHAAGKLTNVNDGAGGLLRIAVTHNRPEILQLLLDLGLDPDERIRVGEGDDAPFSWGMPLQAAVGSGNFDMAETLLRRGADPNASVYASGDPMFTAYEKRDKEMIALLERHGGIPAATTAGLFRQTELAKKMLAGEAAFRFDGAAEASLPEQLLWSSACGGDPEILRLALERIEWRRDDPRWFGMLEQCLRNWGAGPTAGSPDSTVYLTCFKLLLERSDPDLRGRPTDNGQFGLTTLHNIVARGDMNPDDRVRFAAAALDAGARLDIRDNLLKSTPLGWACRWGQAPLVKLFLERGADPTEPDAEGWASPRAWAERMRHDEISRLLDAAAHK